MVYPALLPLMRTPRLPVVDRTGAPADLNELARFAERRNMVSARVPTHFKCNLLEIITMKVIASSLTALSIPTVHALKTVNPLTFLQGSLGVRSFVPRFLHIIIIIILIFFFFSEAPRV